MVFCSVVCFEKMTEIQQHDLVGLSLVQATPGGAFPVESDVVGLSLVQATPGGAFPVESDVVGLSLVLATFGDAFPVEMTWTVFCSVVCLEKMTEIQQHDLVGLSLVQATSGDAFPVEMTMAVVQTKLVVLIHCQYTLWSHWIQPETVLPLA